MRNLFERLFLEPLAAVILVGAVLADSWIFATTPLTWYLIHPILKFVWPISMMVGIGMACAFLLTEAVHRPFLPQLGLKLSYVWRSVGEILHQEECWP